ncbi:MAG TPA: hypothetical protein VEX13_11645 [Chloroflexia bacterium]|nr:hypothetical protein [Chloroflexia bacterium]
MKRDRRNRFAVVLVGAAVLILMGIYFGLDTRTALISSVLVTIGIL